MQPIAYPIHDIGAYPSSYKAAIDSDGWPTRSLTGERQYVIPPSADHAYQILSDRLWRKAATGERLLLAQSGYLAVEGRPLGRQPACVSASATLELN